MALSEKKQTVINLLAKVISYGTTLLISFFLTPYLISKLGKEAYSFYPLANNFVNYMSVVTVALNSMASRFITIALTRGNKEKANTYFASILFANMIMSLFLLIPMTLIVIFLEKILDIPFELVTSVKLLFSLVFISMIVNLLTNVFGVAAFAKNKLYLNSISDIVVGLTRIILYLILFLCFKPTIIFVGVVSVVVALLTVGFQYSFTKKLLPEMKISCKYFHLSAIKEVVSSGIWNSVNQIGVVLLSTMGLMLCNKLYGSSAGGEYSIALTIPQFMNGIVSMLSSVFLPMLTIKYARGDKNEVIKHVQMTQNVIGIIDNVPIVVFMAVGVNFFSLWTPSVNAYRLQNLSVLAIGYLLVTSVAWPISNLNTVMNKVKVPALVMLGTGLINIFLVLITYKFFNGNLYSIPLIQMILFILNRVLFVGIYSAKCLNEKWYLFYPAIFHNLIGAGIIFIISAIVNYIVNPQTWIVLILECIGLGILGLIINMSIVLRKAEMRDVLNKFISYRHKKDKERKTIL